VASSYTDVWLSCQDYVGHVLQLIVPKTREIILATDGHVYVRHNAQNIRLRSPEEITRLQLDKGIVTYEDEVTNVEAAAITNSIVTLSFILDQVPSAEPDDWMKKQRLLIDPGRPTVAGVLLFSDEPQAVLPKRSAIRVLRYGSREEEGRREQLAGDPLTIEGCIYIKSRGLSKQPRESLRMLERLRRTVYHLLIVRTRLCMRS
jgi:ATP-dependent DNA helicase RecG